MSSSEQQLTDGSTSLPKLSIHQLERMSEEEFWSYARQRAHSVPESPSCAEYVECKLGSGTCLIALRDLAEVLSPPHRLARLPGMPAWMAGIVAWRGETIAVVSLDVYLRSLPALPSPQAVDDTLLVAHARHRTLGLLAPALGFTTTIEFEKISALTDSTELALAGKAGIVAGVYMDRPVLNIAALLADLVQQIGMTTAHG